MDPSRRVTAGQSVDRGIESEVLWYTTYAYAARPLCLVCGHRHTGADEARRGAANAIFSLPVSVSTFVRGMLVL